MSRDRTFAKALDLAKADLERLGHRYAAEDIGKRAAAIVKAMDAEMEKGVTS